MSCRSVKEYDTELDYLGSVGYGKDYWCYFHQIKNVKEVDNAETRTRLHYKILVDKIIDLLNANIDEGGFDSMVKDALVRDEKT